MKYVRYIASVLGLKGILSLICMTTIVVALVTYTAGITIDPTRQFSSGAATANWTIYVNEVDALRYLPGDGVLAGASQPPFDAGNASTYAFRVVTDAAQGCAIKLELTAAVNTSKFSRFEITARKWDGVSSWVVETLYHAATGSTAKSAVDGLLGGDSAYIHQLTSTDAYYALQVTYSYDLVDTDAQMTVTIQYTPLPQGSF